MYSQISFPPGVNHIKIKPASVKDVYIGGRLACAEIFKDTWMVFTMYGVVEAIYHMERNVHDWSPSESHAKSHVNKSYDINPFELDTIA